MWLEWVYILKINTRVYINESIVKARASAIDQKYCVFFKLDIYLEWDKNLQNIFTLWKLPLFLLHDLLILFIGLKFAMMSFLIHKSLSISNHWIRKQLLFKRPLWTILNFSLLKCPSENPGSWILKCPSENPCSWILVPESLFLNPCSWILVPWKVL